jgi:phenylpropionate dioxygenase-like ring-hydroxylating dioxygenase large terminal subunit
MTDEPDPEGGKALSTPENTETHTPEHIGLNRGDPVATIAGMAKGPLGRIAEISLQQVVEWAGMVPIVRRSVDRPRRQPMKSSHIKMRRWVNAPFGSLGKPKALGEIPWDYVDAWSDRAPFLGLREYWYPAATSKELRHNIPLPVQMLGESLVLFRDARGAPRTLLDRCPHRGSLLSLGQVGVWEKGTLTCRYHGMTFDGDGECVGFIADGPDSPACGKINAKAYSTQEHGGVVWVYMGDQEPVDLLASLPYAAELFAHGRLMAHRVGLDVNHLASLDNLADLAHPGVLHRSCVQFASQKPAGRVVIDELDNGGIRARFADDAPHHGFMNTDQVEWHLPNLAYFDPGDLSGQPDFGYFWPVPKDHGSSVGWIILARPEPNRVKRALLWAGKHVIVGTYLPFPGTVVSCIGASDAAMMASQGRIPRWDRDRLTRTDVAVSRARRMVIAAHEREVASRAARSAADDSGSSPSTAALNMKSTAEPH